MKKLVLLFAILIANLETFSQINIVGDTEVCPDEIVEYILSLQTGYYFDVTIPSITVTNGSIVSIFPTVLPPAPGTPGNVIFYTVRVKWNDVDWGDGNIKFVVSYKKFICYILGKPVFIPYTVTRNFPVKIGLEPAHGIFHPDGMEVCPGEPVLLNSYDLVNADSYVWSSTNGTIQNNGNDQIYYTPNGSGYLRLYTTGCNGRVSPTYSMYYTICYTSALPTPNYITEITQPSLNTIGRYYTPTIRNACHYEWSITPSARLFPCDNYCDMLATKTGYYEISVRATNCGGVSPWKTFLVYVSSSKKGEVEMIDESKEFSTYPNPANSEFYIQGINSSTVVAIYNVNGQLQKEVVVESSNNPVNISDLSAGVYYLRLNNSENSALKLIVTK